MDLFDIVENVRSFSADASDSQLPRSASLDVNSTSTPLFSAHGRTTCSQNSCKRTLYSL